MNGLYDMDMQRVAEFASSDVFESAHGDASTIWEMVKDCSEARDRLDSNLGLSLFADWMYAASNDAYAFLYWINRDPELAKSLVSHCLRSKKLRVRLDACLAAERLLKKGKCPFSKAVVASAAKSVLREVSDHYLAASLLRLIQRLSPEDYCATVKSFLRRAVNTRYIGCVIDVIERGRLYAFVPFVVELVLKKLHEKRPADSLYVLRHIMSLIMRAECDLPATTARKLVVRFLDCLTDEYAFSEVMLHLWPLLDIWRKNPDLTKAVGKAILRYPYGNVTPVNKPLLAALKVRAKYDATGDSASLATLADYCFGDADGGDGRSQALQRSLRVLFLRTAAYVGAVGQCADTLINRMSDSNVLDYGYIVYLSMEINGFMQLLDRLDRAPEKRKLLLRSVARFLDVLGYEAIARTAMTNSYNRLFSTVDED